MRTMLSILILLMGLAGFSALAEQSAVSKKPSSNATTELTQEQRLKMAGLHANMADCLKSDKAISECRQEMMKGCREAMCKEGCPQGMMMGGMHSTGRHMKGQMSGMMGTELEKDSSD